MSGTDLGCNGRLAWTVCGDRDPEPKLRFALLSFQNWRSTAAGVARRGGAEGARRSGCQRWRVAGVLLTGCRKVSAHIQVTMGLPLFVHYSAAQKQLSRNALVLKEIRVPAIYVFVGYGYVQHTDSE